MVLNDPVRTVIGKIPTVREAQLSQLVKSLDEPGCLLLTSLVLFTTWLTLLRGMAALLGLVPVPKHYVLFPEPFVPLSLQLGARVPSQMFCPPTLSDRDDLNATKSFEKGKITDEGI